MAIGAGSRVALKTSISGVVPGPPNFASVISGADPYVVLGPTWTSTPATVPATSLDEILAPTGGTATTKFLGQRVRITSEDNSGYGMWAVKMVYNRAGTDYAWLVSLAGDADMQVPVSTLTLNP